MPTLAPYSYLSPVWLYPTFPRYHKNCKIFCGGGGILNMNACFDFLYNFCTKQFLTLRTIQRDVIINVHRLSCDVSVMLATLRDNLIFSTDFSKNSQTSNFVKIRPVGADLFQTEGRTNGRTACCSGRPVVAGVITELK